MKGRLCVFIANATVATTSRKGAPSLESTTEAPIVDSVDASAFAGDAPVSVATAATLPWHLLVAAAAPAAAVALLLHILPFCYHLVASGSSSPIRISS